VSPPAASTAAARTVAPPAPRPRRLQAAGAPARTAPGRRVSRPPRPATRRAAPPRRVSGPARRPAAARPPRQAQPPSTQRTVAGGAAAAALRLPDHRLLDRLVRGRYWIGLVGAALIGMVAIQVAMLRINSDIGRYVDRAASLTRANAVLSAENSRLATVSRVEAEGAKLGLVLPSPGGVRYRFARPATDAANAVATMKAPTPAAPVSQAAAPPVQSQSAATTTTPAATTPAAGAAQPTTGTTSGTSTTGAAAQTQTQPQGTSPGVP
jgi:hypothetical protein